MTSNSLGSTVQTNHFIRGSYKKIEFNMGDRMCEPKMVCDHIYIPTPSLGYGGVPLLYPSKLYPLLVYN